MVFPKFMSWRKFKRFVALGIEGRPADDALKEQPFKESAKYGIYNAFDESKLSVLKRIQASCDLFKLRQCLKEECYIGVVGPQDAGKSTFIRMLWRIDVGPIGYRRHTQSAKVYTIRKANKMKVVDFPGSTSLSETMASVIKECGGIASFLILVMPYVGDVSRLHLAEFTNTEDFHLPTLVCINKCGKFPESEDFESKKSVLEARERYAKQLDVNSTNVLFTDFHCCSDAMKESDVVGIQTVRKWIHDKLVEYEFYKEGENELKHAIKE